jgi:N6-adenosine-specific RNA methylase IME4
MTTTDEQDRAAIRAARYDIILADPPWRFRHWSGIDNVGRARRHGLVVGHYQPMNVEDICRLPVQDIAAPDCALFMWATWALLQDALRVIEAWGFTYKTTAFVWVKNNPGGWGFRMGMGYWTRAGSEPCLFATRGKPKRVAKDVGQLVIAPVREHSRKPDEVHEKIVRLMGDLPRVELFARRPYEGWDVWGDEVESTVTLEA